MSYQRTTEGDAYVIGIGGGRFSCCACDAPFSSAKTYREIIGHLETYHDNSDVALERLYAEATVAGLDVGWEDYLILRPGGMDQTTHDRLKAAAETRGYTFEVGLGGEERMIRPDGTVAVIARRKEQA